MYISLRTAHLSQLPTDLISMRVRRSSEGVNSLFKVSIQHVAFIKFSV